MNVARPTNISQSSISIFDLVKLFVVNLKMVATVAIIMKARPVEMTAGPSASNNFILS